MNTCHNPILLPFSNTSKNKNTYDEANLIVSVVVDVLLYILCSSILVYISYI